jgi:hypothetical protein
MWLGGSEVGFVGLGGVSFGFDADLSLAGRF